MTELEYQEHIQYTHNAFCKIVIRHAAIDWNCGCGNSGKKESPFTFLFGYVYTVHSISLNNSVHSSKGIVNGQKKKQDNPAFSEIYLFGDFNRNLKSTIFTMGNQNRSVMTICNLLYNQQP